MDIKEFKSIHYSQKRPYNDKREIFNCRNSVYLVNEIPVDILFIGDSITERFEVYPYFGKYGNIVNRGIGGEATAALKERFYFDALLLKPKVCVIAEGVNDTAELWRAEHDGKTVTEEMVEKVLSAFKDNMTDMVLRLKENGIIPVVGSVLPIGVKDCRNAVIKAENQILKELCERENVYFVDYYSAVVSGDGVTLKDVTFGDDLHPHVEGYNLMAKCLYPVLDEIFGKKQ